MLIYGKKKETFSLKGVVLGKFFNLNCVLRVGNCPFVISKMKNSFHSKWLLISQFKLMRFFFFTWLNRKHFKVIKMKPCWLPPLSFFPHFICKNTYHYLYLHLRKNAQTLKTFAGHGNHKLLSLNVMAVSPPPCYMTVICCLVFLTPSKGLFLSSGEVSGSAHIYKLQIHTRHFR